MSTSTPGEKWASVGGPCVAGNPAAATSSSWTSRG